MSPAKAKTIIVILGLLAVLPGYLHASQPHPISIGLSGETMKLLHPPNSLEAGIGANLLIQYNLTNSISLIGGIGYARLGTDRNFPFADIYARVYRRIFDVPINLGSRYYFSSFRVRPFAGLMATYHSISNRFYYVGLYGGTSYSSLVQKHSFFGITPSIGLEAEIANRLFICADIEYRTIPSYDFYPGYYYFPVQIGFRRALGK